MNDWFDPVIDREHTANAKWDGRLGEFGRADVLPMWVADMDFASPPAVVEALIRRARHGFFGYTMRDDGFNDAVVSWFLRRHQWTIDPASITQAIGVVPALTYLVQALTDPGDGVIIQPPVYHPFARLIESNQRTVVTNPLVEKDGRYEMDYADLEQKAASGAKLFILCSPHNPVGRVWRRDELEQAGEICLRYGVTVISDEIHCDLVYSPHRHTPFASISEAFAEHSVSTLAPSKTFNVAGLHTAVVVAQNERLREAYRRSMQKQAAGAVNPFGAEALKAAYNDGEPWLDALLEYLKGNLEALRSHMGPLAPKVKIVQPEGTYLVWLDFRGLGLEPEALDKLMVDKAKVGLNAGHMFGQGGEGFQRMNIGCPRSLLEEGASRIADAVRAAT